MGFNFPASPVLDQLHPVPAVAGVPQYKWNGSVWVVQMASSFGNFFVSDTAPVGVPDNSLWWDSDLGQLYIRFNDGSSTQWVQTVAMPAVDASVLNVPRNRLINGAMQISQENGNTAGTNPWHAADMWGMYSLHSAGTITAQRVQVVTPNGSANRIRITITAADAALAAGEYLEWFSGMLADQFADFCWGTASAKQSIFRFGFKGPAGTYSISFNNGIDRSYVANFTITAGQANTDTTQTFIIPGDTVVATWGGMQIIIALAAGASFHGVAGWQSPTNKFATVSNTNGMATAGAVFELFDVGWYLDASNTGVVPVWEMPDAAQELIRCQRYYNILTQVYLTADWADTAIVFYKTYTYPPMQGAPSITFSSTGLSNATAPVVASSYINNTTIYSTVVSAGNANVITTLTLNARIS